MSTVMIQSLIAARRYDKVNIGGVEERKILDRAARGSIEEQRPGKV